MSSILDALKKAERESGARGAANLPLPTARAGRRSGAVRRHPWWLIIGTVVLLGIGAAVLWSLSRPPGAPLPAASSPRAAVERKASPPPPPAEPAPHPQASPPAAASEPVVAAPAPSVPQTSVPPAVAARTNVPSVPAASKPATPEPVVDAVDAGPSAGIPTEEAAVATQETEPPPSQEEKDYRKDPRIELQALVWAPAPEARFVVINNRLIKEGGSTDGIVVVRINRDDVLLADGIDRWYQSFDVR